MCGRLNIQATELLRLLRSITLEMYPGEDNYNAAPTESLPVIRVRADGGLECLPMRWWLTPSWSQGPSTEYSMFNAKVETAAKRPAFRGPFANRRCVLPVSGFYEWHRSAGRKQPFLIYDQVGEGLLLAGCWDVWHPKGDAGDAAQLFSFTLLTSPAHPNMYPLHHRQPIFLTRDQALQWLDPANDTEPLAHNLASELPVSLLATPVSSEVNNARNKSSRCVTPVGDSYAISTDVSFDAAVIGTIKKASSGEQESFIVDT